MFFLDPPFPVLWLRRTGSSWSFSPVHAQGWKPLQPSAAPSVWDVCETKRKPKELMLLTLSPQVPRLSAAFFPPFSVFLCF